MTLLLRQALWQATWLVWRPLLELFCHFKIEGQEHCRGLSGPLIVMANHVHYLDPFTLSAAMPFRNRLFPVRFLTSRRYMVMPVIGTVARAYGAISVERGLGMEKALEEPEQILQEGGVVGFFPEGGFAKKEGEFREARPGIAYIGTKLDIPILPVAINGHAGLHFFNFMLRRKYITVVFGKPFTMKELVPDLTFHANKWEFARAAEFAMRRVRHLYEVVS